MIITHHGSVDIDTDEAPESLDFSIDLDSMGLMFRGFSDNLYSNKIGSVIREYTSNCFDSHAEAGVKDNVKIVLEMPDFGTVGSISFIDVGVGLSPNRVRNIFSKYFSSTKRNSNDQIGGFGIGSKVGLSYSDVFSVISRYDGTQYEYLIHRGVSTPRLELLSSQPTTERNGTTVRIPIKNVADGKRFKEEIRQQLRYFDNIEYVNCGVDPDYRIFRGDNWIMRAGTDANVEKLEVCIGTVRYPLSEEAIAMLDGNTSLTRNLKYNSCNFALRLGVGEVSVTMNREAIDYNEHTMEVIKERFALMVKELQELADKRNHTDDLLEWYKRKGEAGIKLDEGVYLKTSVLISTGMTYTPLASQGIKLNTSSNPFAVANIHKIVGKGRGGKYQHAQTVADALTTKPLPLYRLRSKHSPIKDEYIRELEGGQNFATIIPTPEEEYSINSLHVNNSPYSSLPTPEAALVKSHVMKYLVGKSKSYDEVVVPEAWKKDRLEKAKQARIQPATANTSITIRRFQYYATGNGYGSPEALFHMDEISNVEKYFKNLSNRCTVIYGTEANREEIEKLGRILRQVPKFRNTGYGHEANLFNPTYIEILKVAQDNVKYFQNRPNCLTVAEFWQKRYSLIYRTLGRMHWRGKGQNVLLNSVPFYYQYSELRLPHDVAYIIAQEKLSPYSSYNWVNEYVDSMKLESYSEWCGNKEVKLATLDKELRRFVTHYPLMGFLSSASAAAREQVITSISEYLALKPFRAGTI